MLSKGDFPGAYHDAWLAQEPCPGCGCTLCCCEALDIRRPEFTYEGKRRKEGDDE